MGNTDETLFTDPAELTVVPLDDQFSAQWALAADEPLSPEALEDELEGVPPAADEVLHVLAGIDEMVLDEGEPSELPADEDVELAWLDEAGFDDGQTSTVARHRHRRPSSR